MKKAFLDRNEYDVRFIKLPPLPEKRVYSYIYYRIREIYPAKKGEDSFRFRIFKVTGSSEKAAVIVFPKNGKGDARQNRDAKSKLLCPVFYVPWLLKKLPSQWSGIIVITGSSSEEAVYVENGMPLYSRLMSAPVKAENGAVLVLADKKPDQTLLSDFGSVIEFKKKRDLSFARLEARYPAEYPSLTFLLSAGYSALVLVIFALFVTLQTQDNYIQKLTGYINTQQKANYRYVEITEELKELEEKSYYDGKNLSPSPYRVMENLYSAAGNVMKLESFTLESSGGKNRIFLKGLGADPPGLMELLSVSGNFHDLTLDRTKPEEGSYSFIITGKTHE